MNQNQNIPVRIKCRQEEELPWERVFGCLEEEVRGSERGGEGVSGVWMRWGRRWWRGGLAH